MLKWSKNRLRKNEATDGNQNFRNRESTKLDKMNSTKDDNLASPGIKMPQSMVEQESALAEARRRFNAQPSTDSFSSGPNSPPIPTIHVDTMPCNTWERTHVTPAQEDNLSIASSIARIGNSNSNTLERISIASNTSFARMGHSNSSTLERAGAKSKYICIKIWVLYGCCVINS